MENKLTESQIDNQILDHADEITRLMKLKGFTDNSSVLIYNSLTIWLRPETIQVAVEGPHVETIERKKK